jgi:hypothetical protein
MDMFRRPVSDGGDCIQMRSLYFSASRDFNERSSIMLAEKFREAGGWPKDVPPIKIRVDAEGNVIEANGRHRVTVARAVLGPNARIPVKITRALK